MEQRSRVESWALGWWEAKRHGGTSQEDRNGAASEMGGELGWGELEAKSVSQGGGSSCPCPCHCCYRSKLMLSISHKIRPNKWLTEVHGWETSGWGLKAKFTFFLPAESSDLCVPFCVFTAACVGGGGVRVCTSSHFNSSVPCFCFLVCMRILFSRMFCINM